MQWGPICITKKGLWWCLFLVFIHANVISMMMIVAIMMMSRIGSVLMMSLGADWESGCAEPQLGNVMWCCQSWGHTPLHHNNNQDDSDGDSNHQLQNVMQPMLPKILSGILYPTTHPPNLDHDVYKKEVDKVKDVDDDNSHGWLRNAVAAEPPPRLVA